MHKKPTAASGCCDIVRTSVLKHLASVTLVKKSGRWRHLE